MTETHRIPVVVFVETEAVDVHDGAAIAEIALRQALSGEQRPMSLPHTISARVTTGDLPVTITAIKDLNTAAMNGYLRFSPSTRAYPQEEVDQ